ncbi:Holliday junction resolvase RuvX [Propionibacterium sp.]|uniref:Holliday junction resolvase RuvX n=1 Tax=Propionibacterium sp. TaxID=1977903 RepID=UPI0039E7CAAA
MRICVDWGKARIGVAACDREGLLAYPVETVPNNSGALPRLKEIAAEYEPLEIVLGMPIDLRGRRGIAATTMLDVGASIAQALGMDVRLIDERLSTASAAKQLAETGHHARTRKAIIDQAAAVAILEQAIEMEKRTGCAPGNLIPATGREV